MSKDEETILVVSCKDNVHNEAVWQAAFNISGDMLACCSSDKSISLYKVEYHKERKALKFLGKLNDNHHTRTIRGLSFNHSGILASASFDGTVALWFPTPMMNEVEEPASELPLEFGATLEGHENEVKSVAFSSTSPLIATCSRDKSVWIWQIDDSMSGEEDVECLAVLQDHSQDVKYVTWHPTKEWLISGSYDDTIKLWVEDVEGDEWYCKQTLESHTSTVWCMDFDRTGDWIVSVSDDMSIKLWKFGDIKYQLVYTYTKAHERSIYSVSWSKNSDYILTAGGDNVINIFKFLPPNNSQDSSKECRLDLVKCIKNAHIADINCVKWHPKHDGLFVSTSDDGQVKLWEISL